MHWAAVLAVVMVLGAPGVGVAAFLANRLRDKLPELHRAVDSPTGLEWAPFWVFHFVSPDKWRRLPKSYRPWMLLSVVAQGACLGLFLFVVLQFAISGRGL